MSFVRLTNRNTRNKVDIRASAIVAVQEVGEGVDIETNNETFKVQEGLQAVRNRLKKAEGNDGAAEE